MLPLPETISMVWRGNGGRRWCRQCLGCVACENSLRSNLSIIWSISKLVWVKPRRRALRDIALMRFLWLAVSWPAKAGNAYIILDMISPVNNSCSAWTFKPCALSCDNKNKRWLICINVLSTWTETEKVEVISTPSTSACVTRSMFGKGGGDV